LCLQRRDIAIDGAHGNLKTLGERVGGDERFAAGMRQQVDKPIGASHIISPDTTMSGEMIYARDIQRNSEFQ